MTPDDIRFVLAAYRPATEDANDPHFRDALARMDSDPELKAWFDDQAALSAALSGKLAAIPIPPRLRADILAGARASAPSARPCSRARRLWPRMLAAAACLAVAGACIFLWLNRFIPSGPRTYAAYQHDMGSYMSGFFVLDYQSEELEDVKGWLSDEHGFANYTVPASLANHPSLGCEIIDWHGEEVYLICFDVDGEVVHLFAFQQNEALPGAPTGPAPGTLTRSGGWTTTGWLEDGRLYFVSTKGDTEFLLRALGA